VELVELVRRATDVLHMVCDFHEACALLLIFLVVLHAGYSLTSRCVTPSVCLLHMHV